MKIVIAPNAFKGSLSALEAAEAMAEGAARGAPGCETAQVPVSDGGDGLIEVVAAALEGEVREAEVADPLGRPVKAAYLWCDGSRTAVIEMAKASGLALLSEEERDPTMTSTGGTGELVKHALELEPLRVLVGLGGSATCDGGAGMASAFGIRFLDSRGVPVTPAGGALASIDCIDARALDPRLRKLRIEAMCDVDNPLLGEEGAARVFAPQKGASPEQVEELERGLSRLACRIRLDLGVEVSFIQGGGAAGGLGAGLHAFLGAVLRPGVETVLNLLDFAGALKGADLVLTGEGRLDEQTLHGKAPAGVARMAEERGVPCIALAGRVDGDSGLFHNHGFTRVYSLSRASLPLEEAFAGAKSLLTAAAEEALLDFSAGR